MVLLYCLPVECEAVECEAVGRQEMKYCRSLVSRVDAEATPHLQVHTHSAEPEIVEKRSFKPFQFWGYFCPKHKYANIFENYLNPVMLVFIGNLSRVLSDEYPFASVSVIFQDFCFILFWPKYPAPAKGLKKYRVESQHLKTSKRLKILNILNTLTISYIHIIWWTPLCFEPEHIFPVPNFHIRPLIRLTDEIPLIF